jgi:hypothetical protein
VNIFLNQIKHCCQALVALIVILVTEEAEIRRTVVRNQPWANSLQDPISNIPNTKKGWWSDLR